MTMAGWLAILTVLFLLLVVLRSTLVVRRVLSIRRTLLQEGLTYILIVPVTFLENLIFSRNSGRIEIISQTHVKIYGVFPESAIFSQKFGKYYFSGKLSPVS